MLWDSTSSLSTMKHLQQLHLARNRISTLDGLCESCPSLVVLDVRWNVIGSMAGLVRVGVGVYLGLSIVVKEWLWI